MAVQILFQGINYLLVSSNRHQLLILNHLLFGFNRDGKTIMLVEGNVYYMEVLQKESIGQDFVCIGASFPKLKSQYPISSRHLVMGSQGTTDACLNVS